VPDAELFVFSDDQDWCRNNLSFARPYHFVETGSAAKDLFLMQHCRHNIVANSSFSWWGAWLNAHSDKLVIAPANWFSDASMQKNDIVPASWTRIAP
jgi:hypothetical protein